MKAKYSAPICKPDGIIAIQFETDDYNLYLFVKRACQDAVNMAMRARKKEYERMNGGDANGERTDV